MFQRIVDELKQSTNTAIRQALLMITAALALFITVAFLCAAAFVLVLDAYGLLAACLAGAAVFFIAALIAGGSYLIGKRRGRTRAAQRTRSAAHSLLADPVVVASGLQIVKAIGLKRLVPILAIGGIALGLMAGRDSAADQTPAE